MLPPILLAALCAAMMSAACASAVCVVAAAPLGTTLRMPRPHVLRDAAGAHQRVRRRERDALRLPPLVLHLAPAVTAAGTHK